MRGLGFAGAAWLMAGAAHAQSMDIPRIVESTLGPVCGVWMQTGDRAQALGAAEAHGYRAYDMATGQALGSDAAPPSVIADGSARHRGQIMLIEGRDRVCSISMAEATPQQVASLAEATLTGWGMEQVLDRGDAVPQLVVWAGGGRQVVIGPSTLSRGAALTLSWRATDQATP